MKKGLLAIGLLVIAACLQSCVVVIDEDQGHSREPKRHIAPDNTTAEIDAAGKLVLESHRRDAYKSIAERDHLGPDAQIHLVEAVFNKLVLERVKHHCLTIRFGVQCLYGAWAGQESQRNNSSA